VAGAAIFLDFYRGDNGINSIFYNFFNTGCRHCVVCRTGTNPYTAGSGLCSTLDAVSLAQKDDSRFYIITENSIAAFDNNSGFYDYRSGASISAGKYKAEFSRGVVTNDGNLAVLGNITYPETVSDSGMTFKTSKTLAFFTKLTPDMKKIW